MKKRIPTRLLSAFLAVVIVFLMIPFSTTIVYADSVEVDSTIEKYRLDAINGASSQILFEYIADSFNTESVEGSFHKTTTQKNLSTINKGLKIADSGMKLLSLVPGVNVVSKPFGDVLSGIEGITGEFIENDANAQLMDQMNAISVQVSELSKQIDAFAEANRKYMGSVVDNQLTMNKLADYRDTLQEFASDIEGNDRFGEYQSYYSWQKQLYKKLDAVVQAEKIPANATQPLSYYYDDLYLVAKESDELYKYLTGEAFGNITLIEVLYRYYLLDNLALESKLSYQEISEKCIDYSMDWYATYSLSQMCLNMCYIHQLEVLMEEYPNTEFNSTTQYQSNAINNKNVIYDYKEIHDFLANPIGNTVVIENELAKFYARVLCLDEYYIYENGIYDDPIFSGEEICYSVQYEEILEEGEHRANKKTHGVNNIEYYSRVNNLVSTGDTLYMSIFPETVMALFDAKKISFKSDNPELATVNKAGVVNVVGNNGNEFTISMLYDEVELYSMQFIITEREYSGGMGTKDCPYLISSWEDIISLSTNSAHYDKKNIHFKLTNDIDAQNANFTGIPSFSGTLDGNNYSVFRFKIYYNDATLQEKNIVGFIDILNSGAEVKNLSLGKAGESLTSSPDYSADIGTDYYRSSATVNVGGICGINNGTINDCKIEAIYVYAHQGYNVSNANWLNVHVGAVCGQNSGTVSGTEVLNSKITGKADTEKDNSPGKIVVRVGGIVGDHIGGAIKNVYSHDNVLTGYAYSVDKDDVFTNWNEGEAWIRIGGLVGQNSGSAAVEQSYVYNNSLEPSGSSDDLNKQTGEVIGYIGGNSPVDCVVSIKPATGYKSDPELTLEFYAYEYIRGERYLKSSSNGSTKYSLQEHRIDTSNLGDTTAIKLIHISENMYKRKNIAITVVAEEPQELCVYALPHKLTYDRFDTKVDLSGLRLVLLYNNGTVLFLDAMNESEESDNYIESFDFSNEGETNIILKYDGFTTSIPVTVNACIHKNAISKSQVNPSCTEIGYTAGTYCNDCETYISGHEEIPVLSSHPYGDWSYFSETQHVRTCACGEVEYADHAWNDGVVTTESTHLASGEKTYTCTECTATKTEEIPPIEGHTFGKWTKHNDAQHVRSCECGETEYADHNWDDGTITTPATYEKEGVRTYECLDCEATYTVVIPIPVSIHLFVVDDASAVPGGTMQVNVRLENNPGIAMMRLKISYDSSVLDLEQVNYNTEIGGTATQPTIYDGYVTLLWYNDSENVEGDWIFATLTFTVEDTAPVGSVSDIVLTYDAEEVCDIEENNIVFSIDNGSATVLDHVPGDINGDDGLTSKDLLRLARYFAGWEVEVNENALDINGDGNVNSKDLLRLARYLAGWDVEIH